MSEVTEFEKHVIELAYEHHIQVWVGFALPGVGDDPYGEAIWNRADLDNRCVVLTRPPDDAASYLVALHEFGHFLEPRARYFGGSRRTRDREAYAWRWAIDNSRIPVPWSHVAENLQTYDIPRLRPSAEFDALLGEALARAGTERE